MRKLIVLLSGFLFFLCSCANIMIVKENEELVVSEIIKYTSINDIISSLTFFYDKNGNEEKRIYSSGNYRVIFDGMKYDENNNCIEYFQDNPYILYKIYYDSEQRITKKEEYKKDIEIPSSYSIYTLRRLRPQPK